jgi:hypothetical protein
MVVPQVRPFKFSAVMRFCGRVNRRSRAGNGNGGRRDMGAKAARRPAGHYARIQETTNKGRRGKRARPKDMT